MLEAEGKKRLEGKRFFITLLSGHDIRHFLVGKMRQSQSRQGNYVEALKMASTLSNSGFYLFDVKACAYLYLSLFYCLILCKSH
ncbi:hypothetical protein D5R40_21885 [Okeania hirsuta]|uniref:Uncharacterized protein n=1 Tax=Okeania hirsuta TaxID=1458930 RepID=A0A3N6PG23_9CYAN|nr:hypothetical protein D4Z78_15795 [Okeania hirsuta]RQH32891.1 hypothetical protein D5R40_21885 [Okeania hirsuta]